MNSNLSHSKLPVYAWSLEQVEEVADALEGAAASDDFLSLARTALMAAQRVMCMESVPDGVDRRVRAVTDWFVIAPDGSWRPLREMSMPDPTLSASIPLRCRVFGHRFGRWVAGTWLSPSWSDGSADALHCRRCGMRYR